MADLSSEARIVIRGSRAKSFGFALFCGVLLILFLWGPYEGRQLTDFETSLCALVALALFLGLVFFGFQVFRQPKLEISAEGIFWYSGIRTFQMSWKQISKITYVRRAGKIPAMIAISARKDDVAPGLKDRALSGIWEISLPEIAEKLNAAKQKYAG